MDNNTLVKKGVESYQQEFSEGERASIDIITAAVKDRDGEMVLPQGIDLTDYRKNPVVIWGHKHSDGLPIGKNIWIKYDKVKNALIAKTQYAEHNFANEVYEYRKNFPLGVSIGFIAKEWIDREDFNDVNLKSFGLTNKDVEGVNRIFTKCSLLEYSLVNIPSVADATMLAINKGLMSKEEALENKYPVKDFNLDDIEVENKTIDIEEKEIVVDPTDTTDEIEVKDITDEVQLEEKETIEDIEKEIDLDKIIDDELGNLQKELEEQKQEDNKPNSEYIQKLFNSCKVQKSTDDFDISSVKVEPYGFEYKIFTKYLGCKIKNIFSNSFFIPSAMVGNYFLAFKSIFSEHELVDQRNFTQGGNEVPLRSSVIQLKSDLSEEFLTDGTQFYKSKDGVNFIVQVYPGWYGHNVDIYSESKDTEFNKNLISSATKYVEDNNILKGEKFSISGEFLPKSDVKFADIIYPSTREEKIIKTNVDKLSKDFNSRGILFIGPPGTGKTRTGKALMNESESTFIWASAKDFKYGADRALAFGFELARKLAPSIFFMEDIDGWLNSYTVDLVKTEMDGIRENKGVLTILTSNFPEQIPEALIDRPGRFHHIVNFSLPDSEGRKKMLTKWIDDESINIDSIVQMTEGFSGSHIKELVDFAKIISEDEGISIDKALIISMNQMKEQRELIGDIKRKKEFDISDISTKTIDIKEIKEEPKVQSIEIDPEQLVGLVKQAILDVQKKDEIDLSQITIDALKKAKGQLF